MLNEEVIVEEDSKDIMRTYRVKRYNNLVYLMKLLVLKLGSSIENELAKEILEELKG